MLNNNVCKLLDVETAKQVISKLVEKFELAEKNNRLKDWKEEENKQRLIMPLFQALGWDTEDEQGIGEVSAEENISGKLVDYGFRINGIPKFYVEAKKFDGAIDDDRYAFQAINYAHNKGCTWAILTNFEKIRIFNAELKVKTASGAQVTVLDCRQFIKEFDKLFLLSKHAMSQNLIDKKYTLASRQRKIPIDEQLLLDLIKFRNDLVKEIMKKNQDKNLSIYEFGESVQRVLNRLIFVRAVEDRKIIESKLPELYINDQKGKLWENLVELFREYNDDFDSKLFMKHVCDDLIIGDSVLENILRGLHETEDKFVRYNFAAIGADVLGRVYEQYLGHVLALTKKTAKVKESDSKRKKQGIYYTPRYVVNYIVKTTIDLFAEKQQRILKKIRILDPACGSGSFLLGALDYLIFLDKGIEEYQKAKEEMYGKGQISTEHFLHLKSSIFGVDLDPKAVEITQLNLLLRSTERKAKLPMLQENIKLGDSLLDNQKISEISWSNYENEFETIFANGGFDVIVGNPPYVDIKELSPSLVTHLFDKYNTVENRMNLYSVFVHKSLQLLADGGVFGFIIPNSILYNSSYTKIRKLILEKTYVRQIVRLPDDIFEVLLPKRKKIKVETVILILQKKGEKIEKKPCQVILYPRTGNIDYIGEENCKQVLTFDQDFWYKSQGYKFNISTLMTGKGKDILDKIEKDTTSLHPKLSDFSLGLTPYDKYQGHTEQQIKNRVFHSKTKKNSTYQPLLSGENIVRYGVFPDVEEYIKYGEWLGAPREKRFFTKPRILVRQIVSGNPLRIYAGYTEKELYNTQTAFNILVKDVSKLLPKYLLAILNSTLMNVYHRETYLDTSKNTFQKILIENAKKLPIKIADIKSQQEIEKKVDEIISLISRLNELKNKDTDEKLKLQETIAKNDSQINQAIYDVYGITDSEQKILEKSLE